MAGMLRDAVSHDEERHEFPSYIDGALRLSETTAHEVMVPRNAVVSLAGSDSRKSFLTAVRRHPFSRFPVLDRNSRRVVGVVNVNELLADEGWSTVEDRMKAVLTVDPHFPVISVLLQLQQSEEPLAVVTGRSGVLLGLVSLMDVLEEITGDIDQPNPAN
jgi:CBS domain containing-hemolysin-like protein